VLNSGCTQHVTGDSRMFNSINENDGNRVDSITFGDNGKGKVKGLVRLQYPMT
jgi:glutamate 5-kinase